MTPLPLTKNFTNNPIISRGKTVQSFQTSSGISVKSSLSLSQLNTNATNTSIIHRKSTTLKAAAAAKPHPIRSLHMANSADRFPGSPNPFGSYPISPNPDITTLLLDHAAIKDTIDLSVERYKDKKIDVVAGVEARGFIFGPPIALAIGEKFLSMRKPKKLPGEVISEEYPLEYGTDKIEMHVGAVQPGEHAVIVDDLIATGGTLNAAICLLERVGVDVVECARVIELPELKGRDKLGDKSLFVFVN